MASIGALALAVQPVAAQQAKRTPNIIRDAEIENLLRDYMRPIYRVAGLTQQNIEVVLIGDKSFNAFVADGKRIFVNIGALMQSETPNEIIGVLAHETGHIAGGHLARMRQQLESAQTAAIVAMILAAGGVAAGAAGGANMGGAAAGAVLGPQEAIRRTLLAYQRGEEQAADRAAVTYLAATKQSPMGMMRTFERFQNDQIFISQRISPYVLSHPMARERVAALEDLVAKSPYKDAKDSPQLQARHDMMRAKLYGFSEPPDSVARRYPLSNMSLPARYARAISAYRYGSIPDAIRQIDGLIAEQPDNPYFYEIKGQALLEAGRAREAVPPLRRAAQLSNGHPLIRMLLGQALVAAGDKASLDEAIRELNFSLQRENTAPAGWRYLAMAYGQKGDIPNADLASAQAAFMSGDFQLARELAGRARLKFPLGSPGWLKADDIVNFKPPAQAIRKKPQ
ncbi:M48 family metalloprotease [Bosea sp. 117]|uniref:M48 family metalloprotease n=1 Tax=Bosea sp. 117 TaxID=1125973 RepID=UPI000A73C726|nr:M48 family metalloprotease [Bosea sp. 117]